DVEAVPLGADLPAPGLSDGSSDHLAIRGQQLGRCPVPVLLDEGGIAAKVAEEEPAGQPGGGWSGGVVRQVLGRGCLIGCSGFDHGRIMRAARVPLRSLGMVGARGFEPPTSSSRTMRATWLRHAPTGSSASRGPEEAAILAATP